jgi:hypothetical protein
MTDCWLRPIARSTNQAKSDGRDRVCVLTE